MSDAFVRFAGSAASTSSALTNTQVQAAPAAGKRLVVRKVIFTNEGTANSFKIMDGSGGSTLTPPGMIYLGANQSFTYKPLKPPRLTAATGLFVTTTAADHASIVCEGSIEPSTVG